MTATALEVRRDVIKRHKQGPKTGRMYRRGSRNHQASAPGEAPAIDTGTLVSSVYFTQPKRHEAVVGSRLAYAFWLEFGSQVTDARPSWLPAVEKARPQFTAKANAILRKFGR